jgi:hypothetical protein
MNPEIELQSMLSAYDFSLVRQRKHKIYKNAQGLTFVSPSTPSDRRGAQNQLSTFKRYLRQSQPEPQPIVEALQSNQAIPEPSPWKNYAFGECEPLPEPLFEPDEAIEEVSVIVPEPVRTPRMTKKEWAKFKAEYDREVLNQSFVQGVRALFDWSIVLKNRLAEGKLSLEGKPVPYRDCDMSEALRFAARRLGYRAECKWFSVVRYKQGIQTLTEEQDLGLWFVHATNGYLHALFNCGREWLIESSEPVDELNMRGGPVMLRFWFNP